MQVSLGTDKGRLRLRWRYAGQRYALYLGWEDTKTNRRRAQDIKLLIEADLEEGRFDPSLAKYKPDKETGRLNHQLSVLELYQKWIAAKSPFVDENTVQWYRQTIAYLNEYGVSAIAIARLNKRDTSDFAAKLTATDLHPETAKRKLENLTAAWKWGIEHNFTDTNPWFGLSGQIKVPSRPQPEPFTKQEMDLILEGFQEHYPSYLPFTRFLFGTGARPGEAIAVRWRDLSDDCSRITIADQVTRGKRKEAKSGKFRRFKLSNNIREMLLELRERKVSDNDLIFRAPNGGKIYQANYLADAWTPVLTKMGVKYRPPKFARKTFVSHCLQKGMSPAAIAKITGHSTETMFNHYVGQVEEENIPDL